VNWTDQGIIIGTRRHGETSLIVEVMTEAHGRHLGLVKGGRGREHRAALQPGNTVSAAWRARLDEHLGNWSIEPTVARAARLMETGSGVYGLQMVAALLRILPERDPHPALYAALAPILDSLDDPYRAGEVLVRFELLMLAEFGFGLDLSRCAATGLAGDLAFVSPKTGRAVSREAGAAYADRMFAFPRLFAERRETGPASGEALSEAFALTGYFLSRHVFEPRGEAPPRARESFLALIGRLPASA